MTAAVSPLRRVSTNEISGNELLPPANPMRYDLTDLRLFVENDLRFLSAL